MFSFFSSGYLDVSVHRVPSVSLWIHDTVTEVYSAGFPHSDIRGSMLICSSPRLFAAYHVFLRLLVPRHPPCALLRLTAFSRLAWRYFGFFLTFIRSFFLFQTSSFIQKIRKNLPILRSKIWPRMSCYLCFRKLWYFKIFSVFGFQGTILTEVYQSSESKNLFCFLITGKNQHIL